MPLIIPPTLTKGPYFTNLTLRAQWRRAAEALRAARRLTVMGYSFPPADLIARQWVGTSFDGERMDVVDRDPERPGQIRAALSNSRDGLDLVGDDAVRFYVDRECGDHVAWQIWVDTDGQVNGRVLVNGKVRVHGVGEESPWESNNTADAQFWIHSRVDLAAGDPNRSVVQQALGATNAAHEDRYVVLPVGSHLDV